MTRPDRTPHAGARTSAKKTKRRPHWTKAEVTILKRLYRAHSNADIAKVLGRKVASVVFKAHRLRISKGIRRLREMGRENILQRLRPKNRKGAGNR